MRIAFVVALLRTRVVYQAPSATRRSGASQTIVMTVCEKKEKTSAGNDLEATQADSVISEDSGGTHHTSKEIIDRSTARGGKTKKEWLCSPGMYKVGVEFSLTA